MSIPGTTRHINHIDPDVLVEGEGPGRLAQGELRLIMLQPTWEEVLDLALAEIRLFGATSPQVTRRRAGLLDTVALVATEVHRPAIERQRRQLVAAGQAAVSEQADRQFALTSERRGLG